VVLRRAVQSAIAAAKVPGDVTAVDCSASPCVVFGEVRAKDGQDETSLDDALGGIEDALRVDYPEDSNQLLVTTARVATSTTGGKAKPVEMFGIALAPGGQPVPPELADQVSARTDRHFGSAVRQTSGP